MYNDINVRIPIWESIVQFCLLRGFSPLYLLHVHRALYFRRDAAGI